MENVTYENTKEIVHAKKPGHDSGHGYAPAFDGQRAGDGYPQGQCLQDRFVGESLYPWMSVWTILPKILLGLGLFLVLLFWERLRSGYWNRAGRSTLRLGGLH